MTMETVTLGHFPAPVVTAEDVATVKAAGKAAISSKKAVGKHFSHPRFSAAATVKNFLLCFSF